MDKHNQAMNILDELHPNHRIAKQDVNYKNVMGRAFVLEKQAAQSIPLNENIPNEPTRSVLFRSAGWMAYNAEMYNEALEMVEDGLKGAIHSDIIDELNELKSEILKKTK